LTKMAYSPREYSVNSYQNNITHWRNSNLGAVCPRAGAVTNTSCWQVELRIEPQTVETDLDIRMTPNPKDPTNEPQARRGAWLAVLARASLSDLQAHLPRLDALPNLQRVRVPEVGMVMLRGRVGGTGNPFNLGEASVVRCALRLGDGPLGVAYALGRDTRRAELAALADALLQDPAHHDALQHTLIQPLAAAQRQARAQRQAKVAPSKVEFFTLVRGNA
jgi:alpha-D-ribose 1-methylphosphonate 5-triphosphate synthase subunit PhnG